jgi:hypothetical protein
MQSLWERLDILRAIVDTVRAEELERQPDAVRTRYEPYADAYFVIEAVKRVEQRLITELRAGKSVTGYLSADYGYGKTATAVYLWKRCLDSEIVAVPPFLFRQLKDIMLATKGWLAYQLRQTHPTLLPQLETAYQQYAEQSHEELAESIAAQQGISKSKALAIVREHLAQRRDLTTSTALLNFLDKATELAVQAGFKGLVIFADESQEFLRTEEAGAHEAIQTLSELVKGIRAMGKRPLGLMLTMPVNPTETAIEEQAGDIMHRLRERGTGLQLQDAYGREFPKALWDYLCQSFGDDTAARAVDARTLEALGQLCERKDLSNGPRTVINAFKRIAHHHQKTHRPYTPIDLMDDYLQGHIVFEGREAKLTSTLHRLLELPTVSGNPQRQQAVKLLAAFPRGVDESRAGELYSVISELADRGQWLGEHLTQLAEGYALIALQERVEARPLLDEIIRDFRRLWHDVYTEPRKVELAAKAFLLELLPMLFPKRGSGQYANFSGHKDPDHDAHGVAYLLLEGCYERLFSRFPDRKVCVSVSMDTDALMRFQSPDDDLDLDIRFFLERPDSWGELTRIESANQDRRVDFHLNLKRTFGRQFPHDLAFLHDIMAPERTSAEVLLGLSMRMRGWLHDHPETSESDRQLIESSRRALHRYALQLLLPDASDSTQVQLRGIVASGAGQRLVESVFEAKCAELYPNYQPLMTGKEWKSYLRQYRDLLNQRPLAERRGRQPFVGTKDAIANAFGRSHTAAESNAQTLQSMGLLEARWGSGRGAESRAEIHFKQHPLESLLLTKLQQEGRSKTVSVGEQTKRVKSIEVSCLRALARREGYLPDEVDEAIRLLVLRQYITRESDGTVQEFAGALDADELRHQARELEEQLRPLMNRFHEELRAHTRLLSDARAHLENPEDEVALDSAQRTLHELRVRLDEFIKSKARELANQLMIQAEQMERRSAELQPRELEQQVTGAVDFVRHVDDQRRALEKQFRQLNQKWQQLQQQFAHLQQQTQAAVDSQALCDLLSKRTTLETNRQQLDAELEALRPYLTGLQRWREIVLKATALREKLELGSPLRQRLDEETNEAIVENFAVRQREALLDWERYKADIDAIEAEINAEENRQRNEFHQNKEKYEQALGQLTQQRMVQATFDPKEPEQSYQVLYQSVLEKLQIWLREQREFAQRTLDELEYLVRERGIQASEARDDAQQVLNDIQEAACRLDLELVKDLDELQRYCGELRQIHERLQKAHNSLIGKRAEKELPTDDEKTLLQTMTTQRRSLEEIRRQLPSDDIPLHDLFQRLKELYRKGHIEIEVRRRD